MRHRIYLPDDLMADIDGTLEQCVSYDVDCASCAKYGECLAFYDSVVGYVGKMHLSDGMLLLMRDRWSKLKTGIVDMQNQMISDRIYRHMDNMKKEKK